MAQEKITDECGGDRETQGATQTQSSNIWSQIESQPIENIIWGRLYPKSIKLKSLDLCNEQFSAGRAEACDLPLTENDLPLKILCRISKVHFEIKRENCDFANPVYIEDKSRNGTFLNGEKIGMNERRILMNDDIIALAHPIYKAFVFKDLSPNEAIGLPREITLNYYVSKKLGSGACGLVRMVYDKRSCQQYAMKHVKKNMLSASAKTNNLNDPDRVMNEAKIMKALEHPCVIKMHDIVNKTDSLFMVLELMKGGDLLSRILSNKQLSEPISKLYFYQMCCAVKYLHDKGITHRDLKPDNVLLDTEDDETLIKVSDFGLSKFVRTDSEMKTLCGTTVYVAPEVLLTGGRGAYTKKVDIWSLGVVLFTCLSGTLPFSDDYGTPAADQIKNGIFKFKNRVWKTVSPDAKMLIKHMLTVAPNKRPSIDYVLKHNWLKDNDMIKKAAALMKNNTENDENFVEPPLKRAKWW